MPLTRSEQELKDTSTQKVLEDADIAFDPTVQYLDLSKEEKRRTTALLMAIQAYQNLIIKDADYLREATNNARTNQGPQIAPATMNAMVEAAVQFDFFIANGGMLTTEEVRQITQAQIGAPTETEEEPERTDT